MNENEVKIIEGDIVDLTARPQANGGLLEANTDNILYLADKAEKYIEAMNRIMDAALKITNELGRLCSRLLGCDCSDPYDQVSRK